MKYKGTDAEDVYLGTAQADTIEGLGGNDTLSGRGSNDVIAGGAGADTLDGGDGDDVLFSETIVTLPLEALSWRKFKGGDTLRAKDVLSGGDGIDTIVAGTGDTIDGGAGDYDQLVLNLMHERGGLVLDLAELLSGAQVTWGSTSVAAIEQLRWLRATEHADELRAGDAGEIHWLAIDMGDGNDSISVGSGRGWIDGGDGDDAFDAGGFMGTLYGGSGNDHFKGGDTVRGDAGDDDISGATHAYGGDGNDQIRAAGGAVWGEAGDDILTGTNKTDRLGGGEGADVVIGGGGNDSLGAAGDVRADSTTWYDTGAEHDLIEGGDGDDLVSIGFGDDADGGAGRDALRLSLAGAAKGVVLDTRAFLSGGTVTLGGGTITGFETVNALTGSAFADRVSVARLHFSGGGGDDRLTAVATGAVIFGDAGDDVVFANGAGREYDGGDGFDTIDFSALTRGIRTGMSGRASTREEIYGFEKLIATGFADTLIDYTGDSTILGGDGDDHIDISTGTDRIDGGAGDDRLTLTSTKSVSSGDRFGGGAGYDRLSAAFSLDLSKATPAGDIEWISAKGKLTLGIGQDEGIARIDATGLDFATAGSFDLRKAAIDAPIFLHKGGNQLRLGDDGNDVTGGNGADVVIAGGGRDVLRGGGGDDRLDGGQNSAGTGANELWGEDGDDALIGGAGSDKLYGGAGADRLEGRGGDDRYFDVETADTVYEREGDGIDTVEAKASYVLSGNVENLVLLILAVNGTGNNLANTITGNGAANVLDGKSGADVLIGGMGNDTYVVDQAGDRIVEADIRDEVDLVQAYASFTLSANVENMQMMVAGTGTGNAMDNVLTGSAGADVLNGMDGDDRLTGGAGLDRLIGGAGSDTYYVEDSGDVVVEVNDGYFDIVYASADFTLGSFVEALTLSGAARAGTGNDQDNTITGTAGDDMLRGMGGLDILYGGTGNDVLVGGAGPDALFGHAGADRFVFEVGDGHPDPFYLDGIADFSQTDGDRIDLSALGRMAFIGTAAFGGGAQVRYEGFAEGTLIEIDLNGDRVADMNIGLIGYPVLTAADFILA